MTLQLDTYLFRARPSDSVKSGLRSFGNDELRKTSTGKGAVANANLSPLPRSQPSGSTSQPSTSSSSQPTAADVEGAMCSDDESAIVYRRTTMKMRRCFLG